MFLKNNLETKVMKNKRNLRINAKYEEDLEPLFTIHKEELPTHIKYIKIQSPVVIVEHYKSKKRKYGLCGIIMAVIIFISIIVAVTIQQFDKDHDELPDLSKLKNNNTITELEIKKNTTTDIKHNRAVLNQFVPCRSTCRQYSAFRFKSTCVHGKCKCNSPFYNTLTCLPVVNGCVIRKTKRNDDYISQGSPTYFCRSVTNVTQKEVHIISMYGKSGHDQSFIKFVTADDSRGKDVVLVLANFLKTRWNLDISNKVNLKKIYLISNKYLMDSTLEIKQSYNKSVPPEIIKVFSHVGYGDDTNNGYTVDLLRIITSEIGQISSFHGRTYSSEWHLNL